MTVPGSNPADLINHTISSEHYTEANELIAGKKASIQIKYNYDSTDILDNFVCQGSNSIWLSNWNDDEQAFMTIQETLVKFAIENQVRKGLFVNTMTSIRWKGDVGFHVNGSWHCDTGPAIYGFFDGSRDWWYEGTRITNHVVEVAKEWNIDLDNLTDNDLILLRLKCFINDRI